MAGDLARLTPQLRGARRFYQFLSGHAVIAPLSQEKAGADRVRSLLVVMPPGKTKPGTLYQRKVRVEGQQIHFPRDTARWLGVGLDAASTLREKRRRCLNRARQAEARLRRIVNPPGIGQKPPTINRTGHPALRPPSSSGTAGSEWRESTGANKSHGKGVPGGLPANSPRRRSDRERPHPGAGPV